jgi:hypothetical protein
MDKSVTRLPELEYCKIELLALIGTKIDSQEGFNRMTVNPIRNKMI